MTPPKSGPLFLNQDIIVLLKPSINEELFILINEEAIKDKDPLNYLKRLESNPANSVDNGDGDDFFMIYALLFVVAFFILIIFISSSK